MNTPNTYLQQVLLANQQEIAEAIQERYIRYLMLLRQWNQVVNLTAIHDINDMILLHIIDSLSILSYVNGEKVIDVGSGAGLPGIPLALALPEKQFVLLDSNHKKTRFLTQVVYELGIKNVTVVHSRCETFIPSSCFDTIITRAFASIKTMLMTTQHLLCEQGQFLAMKGNYPEQEIKDIPDGFVLLAAHRLRVNALSAERHLICVGKEEPWVK